MRFDLFPDPVGHFGLTLKSPGGSKWPTANQKRYISGTECPIDLKPVCKFKFSCCLQVYLKKLINLDHEGALEGLFFKGSPEICLTGSILGSILGSMMVHDSPGASPGPWQSSTMTKKIFYNVQSGCRLFNVQKVCKAWNFFENLLVYFRVPVGSIEGPGRVLDPIIITSSVPRVPWYGLLSLSRLRILSVGLVRIKEPQTTFY